MSGSTLGGKYLSGTLPSSLGALVYLQKLCVLGAVCQRHEELMRCSQGFFYQRRLAHRHHPELIWQSDCVNVTVRALCENIAHSALVVAVTALNRCGRPVCILANFRFPHCVPSLLNGNKLSGTLPASLSALPNLLQLCVRFCSCKQNSATLLTRAAPRTVQIAEQQRTMWFCSDDTPAR